MQGRGGCRKWKRLRRKWNELYKSSRRGRDQTREKRMLFQLDGEVLRESS